MKRTAIILLIGLVITGITSCELFPPYPGNGGGDKGDEFIYLATNCPNGDVEQQDTDGNYLCTEEDGSGDEPLTLLYLRCAPEELRPNPCPPPPPTQIPGLELPISDFQILVHTPDPGFTAAQIVNFDGKVFAESNPNSISFDPDVQFATINFEVVDEGLIGDELVLVVKTGYLDGQQNIATLEMISELKSGAFTLK